MSRHHLDWNEPALRDRMQAALRVTEDEPPATLTPRAAQGARTRAPRQGARPWRSWAGLTALASVSAVWLAMPRLSQPNPDALPIRSGLDNTRTRTAPGTGPQRVAQGVKRRAPAAPSASLTGAAPISAATIALWQQQQARDFDGAARLLEQAGQVEPAYQLYSSSLEVAPSLEATMGVARTLRRMDEAAIATRAPEVEAPDSNSSSG